MYHDGAVQETHGIYNVPVVDTTAAGDTFTGYFLACVTEGLDVKRALELASKASSLAVSAAGASDSIPTRAQVETTDIVLQN
jgi:ribokinase